MSWKQWTAVAAVIGLGIVLQIPGHDDLEMDHDGPGAVDEMLQMSAEEGPYRTVALDVTGMT